MRIPDGVMSSLLGNQLSSVTDNMARLQLEIASGKRIQRPSDDPGGALRASNLRSGMTLVTQYKSTVDDSELWLKSEDQAFNQITSIVRQVRDVTLQGANPLNQQTRDTLANQIDTLAKSLIQTSNSGDGIRYLFGGFQTVAAPFAGSPGAVTYSGDNGYKKVSIGDGMQLQLNHTGAEVFNMGGVADATLDDLFTTINIARNHVQSGDQAALQTDLAAIDKHLTRITSQRAETGIKLQQCSLSSDRLTQTDSTLNDLLGATESSDVTQALVHLKEQENVYQAASYISGKVGNGGLLQWLR